MSTLTNAEKIQEWHKANPDVQITTARLRKIIDPAFSEENLSWANLRGANLSGANLRGADLDSANLSGASLDGADLSEADLREADLRGANLDGVDLTGADLDGANLRWASLSWANLTGANLDGANLRGNPCPIFSALGMPSGDVVFCPTPSGWQLRVGCWTGTLDSLTSLIAGDEWPEATGDEIDRRRPGLQALITLLRAHEEYHQGVITELQEHWGTNDTRA